MHLHRGDLLKWRSYFYIHSCNRSQDGVTKVRLTNHYDAHQIQQNWFIYIYIVHIHVYYTYTYMYIIKLIKNLPDLAQSTYPSKICTCPW